MNNKKKYYCIKDYIIDNSFNPNHTFPEKFEKGKIYYAVNEMGSSSMYVYDNYDKNDVIDNYGNRFSLSKEDLYSAINIRNEKSVLSYYTKKEINENDYLTQPDNIINNQMGEIGISFAYFNDYFVDFYQERKRKIKKILE